MTKFTVSNPSQNGAQFSAHSRVPTQASGKKSNSAGADHANAQHAGAQNPTEGSEPSGEDLLLALFGAPKRNTRAERTSAQQRLSVERAIADFRAGYPVIMNSSARGNKPNNVSLDAQSHLLMAAESVDDEQLAALGALFPNQLRVVLTASRLRHLGVDTQEPGVCQIPHLNEKTLKNLVVVRQTAPISHFADHVQPAAIADRDALQLAAFALVLPAVLSVRLEAQDPMRLFAHLEAQHPLLLSFEAEALLAYQAGQSGSLKLVSRAKVPLENSITTEFVVFRGGEGLRDQVAILVGEPDLSKPVPVRLHSACLTGDLFGSLKCDCGDQLRGTIAYMAEQGGGILLYLDQEGRGTGIGNKMRAYALQAAGLDTYDADQVLGFELDQRSYGFAACMLKLLGASSICLLTNNPDKIAAMRAHGLDVITHARVLGRKTKQNTGYLAAKRDKAGHLLEPEPKPQ